ncbi:hypothetical protein F5Y05DRAFT_367522, partial [Hypoxylon sp. FL0543]
MGQTPSRGALRRNLRSRFFRTKSKQPETLKTPDSPKQHQSPGVDMAPLKHPSNVPNDDYPEVISLDDDPAEDFDISEITQTLCKDGVKAVFPDICLDYLETIASDHAYNSDEIIGVILDLQEKGEGYPVRPRDNPLKRKRADDDDDD